MESYKIYWKKSKIEGNEETNTMITEALNKIIEEFSHLPLEDREYAVQVMEKQLIEAKREGIAKRAKEAVENYRKGNFRIGNVSDLYKDLESD
jgi:hypothetical protein